MEHLKITQEIAKKEFDSVDKSTQGEIIQNLMHVYHISRQTRQHPTIVYWDFFNGVFAGIDITDFMAIDDPTQFVYEAIYYMARFFRANGRTNQEEEN
jgi:hypothetical protein